MIVGSQACQADVAKVMELMVRETQWWENACVLFLSFHILRRFSG